MPKFRTHYDNLKVSRDAPIEVIQAAYRTLARKYHPDMNASAAKAEAVMKIINASYEVLSDPTRRAEHDRWIAEQEQQREQPAPQRRETYANSRSYRESPPVRPPSRETPSEPRRSSWSFANILVAVSYVAVALILIRTNGLRYVGIGMLIAGWLFIRRR